MKPYFCCIHAQSLICSQIHFHGDKIMTKHYSFAKHVNESTLSRPRITGSTRKKLLFQEWRAMLKGLKVEWVKSRVVISVAQHNFVFFFLFVTLGTWPRQQAESLTIPNIHSASAPKNVTSSRSWHHWHATASVDIPPRNKVSFKTKWATKSNDRNCKIYEQHSAT